MSIVTGLTVRCTVTVFWLPLEVSDVVVVGSPSTTGGGRTIGTGGLPLGGTTGTVVQY
jgi:hypothetical protein